MAGGSSSGGGGGEMNVKQPEKPEKTVPVKQPETSKVKTVNPAEDLLLKSKKKKDKKEKEVIAKAIPIPSSMPIPKPLDTPNAIPSAPSAIPSPGSGSGGRGNGAGAVKDGSGVGIGVGDGVGEDSGFSGGGNFPYTWYVHSVKKKLDSNWNVVSGFDRRIFTQMAFTIGRNGNITEIEVEESSGNDAFDLAARRAVEYSSPLPPLPGDFQEPNLRVHVRFTVKN